MSLCLCLLEPPCLRFAAALANHRLVEPPESQFRSQRPWTQLASGGLRARPSSRAASHGWCPSGTPRATPSLARSPPVAPAQSRTTARKRARAWAFRPRGDCLVGGPGFHRLRDPPRALADDIALFAQSCCDTSCCARFSSRLARCLLHRQRSTVHARRSRGAQAKPLPCALNSPLRAMPSFLAVRKRDPTVRS